MPRGSIYKTLASQYTPEQQAASDAFLKQWGFIPNPSQLMTYMEGDTAEIKSMILRAMAAINAEEKYINAARELEFLITPRNQDLYSDEEKAAWVKALGDEPEGEQEDVHGRNDTGSGDPGTVRAAAASVHEGGAGGSGGGAEPGAD